MLRSATYSTSAFVFLFMSLLILSSKLSAQEIGFDCPAVAGAIPILETEEYRLIEIPLSFSTSVDDSSLELEQVRAEVSWNRDPFLLTDYGPRTVLQAEVAGNINIEEKEEAGFGIDGALAGSYLSALGTPNLSADANRKRTKSTKFAKIPEHKLVVSSGPVKRGTGAFFEFYPSPTESLEGGRNLVVAFEVPVSWSAGILQITCHARGNRKRMGIFNNGFINERLFIVPVFLKGDDQAFHAAKTMARKEQQLRSEWQSHRESSADGSKNWFAGLQSGGEPDDLWMHRLIYSGTDQDLRAMASRLPGKVLLAAKEFDLARKDVLLRAR